MVAFADDVAFALLTKSVNDALARDASSKLSYRPGAGKRSETLTATLRDIINASETVWFRSGVSKRTHTDPGWLVDGDVAKGMKHIPTPATLYVDPFGSVQYELFVEVNGVVWTQRQHPVAALAHELAHATDYVEGTTKVTSSGGVSRTYKYGKGPRGGTIEEFAQAQEHEAVDFENVVRRELGMNRRVFYATATATNKAKVNTASGSGIIKLRPA